MDGWKCVRWKERRKGKEGGTGEEKRDIEEWEKRDRENRQRNREVRCRIRRYQWSSSAHCLVTAGLWGISNSPGGVFRSPKGSSRRLQLWLMSTGIGWSRTEQYIRLESRYRLIRGGFFKMQLRQRFQKATSILCACKTGAWHLGDTQSQPIHPLGSNARLN